MTIDRHRAMNSIASGYVADFTSPSHSGQTNSESCLTHLCRSLKENCVSPLMKSGRAPWTAQNRGNVSTNWFKLGRSICRIVMVDTVLLSAIVQSGQQFTAPH